MAETITAEIGDIAETTYEVDVEDRLRLLDETAKAVELLVKARYFQCWRNQHAGLFTGLNIYIYILWLVRHTVISVSITTFGREITLFF